MRRALPLLLIVLLTPSAAAITYDLEAREDAKSQSYFVLAGDDVPNPTLSVPPGDTLTIRFANRGSLNHNLHLGAPLNAETPCCQAPGENRTLIVQIPRNLSGEVRYQDVLHASALGALRIGPPVATIRIVTPSAGATVPRSVTMEVRVANFTPGVDGKIRYSYDSGNTTRSVNETATTHIFTALGNGPHLLGAELVGIDGASLQPPARADLVVFVPATATEGPPQPPESAPTPPPSEAPAKSPDVALPLALLVIALVALRARR